MKDTRHQWAVFEQYGYRNERFVSSWVTFDDAYCAIKENYTPEEEEELRVSIVRWDEDTQDWTTEY
ncbi:MAG: hypothetical protein WBI41_05790 [Azovibrio sp.]|uniref:hypothetical protein n=1 Tax=Azovibrio sp. TaxID=1872673 RepID=UPI003C7686CF